MCGGEQSVWRMRSERAVAALDDERAGEMMLESLDMVHLQISVL